MVDIEFCKVVPSGDPLERPITIIGKKTNLSKVPFASVLPYFGNKVSEEVSFGDDLYHNIVLLTLSQIPLLMHVIIAPSYMLLLYRHGRQL